jgi:hypothetical protein
MIEVEKDVLQRYMEVYSRPQYWTGYELINETAVVPGTNNGISLVGSPNCSNCCVAWQLDPYGPIALECDKILPAICTISLNFPMLDVDSTASSGFGANNPILVDGEMFKVDKDITFGSDVTLTCNHEGGADVRWYRNSKQLDGNVVRQSTSSSLTFVFTTPGVYQCEVTTDILATNIGTVTLCGVVGNPGDVEVISAAPVSQTELEVIWHPPQILGTSDPFLLRYNVFYELDDVLDDKSIVIESVLPEFPDGTVKIKLSDLSKGSTYVIGVVATSMSTAPILLPQLNILVSTYGIAPALSVSNLTVQQYKDEDKALIVSWERANLTPPEGPVSHYLVEYRDAQQALSNTARVPPETPFLVLWDISNANDYEVRVAIYVEIQHDPVKHDNSPWSDWVRVSGTTSEFPTSGVKPTTLSDVVVAAVIVPIAVILILLLLLVAALCWGYSAWRESSKDFSVMPDLTEKEEVTSTV